MENQNYNQWQIQDFPNRVLANFSKECMEMKIVWLWGGGGCPGIFSPFCTGRWFCEINGGIFKVQNAQCSRKKRRENKKKRA